MTERPTITKHEEGLTGSLGVEQGRLTLLGDMPATLRPWMAPDNAPSVTRACDKAPGRPSDLVGLCEAEGVTYRMRTREEIVGLLDPGLVPISRWPEHPLEAWDRGRSAGCAGVTIRTLRKSPRITGEA
ncbi:hypothetical protein [Streptomyces sp. NPDC046887]|uniref:hypothetical protein n=1 Tax=Streptomyces sp. NPDC046887 TaxID=3155472 RepID=UPI0033F6C0A9